MNKRTFLMRFSSIFLAIVCVVLTFICAIIPANAEPNPSARFNEKWMGYGSASVDISYKITPFNIFSFLYDPLHNGGFDENGSPLEIDISNYTVTETENGSKITLKEAYLKSLGLVSGDSAKFICNTSVVAPLDLFLAVDYVFGDVNNDGKISAIDASLVLQYDARLIKEDGLNIVTADVNGDGKINAIDASLILQYDAKLINKFPFEDSTDTDLPPSGDTPFLNDVSYNSVGEFITGISNDFTNSVLQEYESYHGKNKGDILKGFIENLKNGSTPLYIPYYQGKEIEFRNKEGFSNIAVFPSELYGQPWIWFFPEYEKTDIFSIAIMYLDDDIKAIANEKGAPWLMEQMNPNGKGDNIKPYPLYDDISTREIAVKGKTSQVLIGQYKDDTRINIWIVCDDVLARIIANPEVAYDWVKELSFEKVSLKSE